MTDLISRAALLAVFASLAAVKAMAVIGFVEEWTSANRMPILDLLSQLTSIAFIGLLIFMTLTRLEARKSLAGWEPRFSALMGTFLTFLVPLLPQAEVRDTTHLISILLMTLGFMTAAWVLLWLGRSLSITAQARELVTAGPYALVRHPLYLAEEIGVIGIIASQMSLESVLLGLVHWAFQVRRMANEERVLRATFPEYAAYASKTPMLFPGCHFAPIKYLLKAKQQPA
jgi:protein-S-isoprenylcysteine O-methyltransferase Ste14